MRTLIDGLTTGLKYESFKSVDSSTTGVDSRHIRQRRQPRQDAGDWMDSEKRPT